VIEATETGEIIGLSDIPYRLGVDKRSYLEPSSSSVTGDPYCTQGFTYTFAMEETEKPQTHEKPVYYERYAPYFSYELPRLADFDLVFTYRRIWSPQLGKEKTFGGITFTDPSRGIFPCRIGPGEMITVRGLGRITLSTPVNSCNS